MGGGVGRPRFVGRAEEIARLKAALDDASAGRPRVVLLAGEAGIGKTRLLQEVTDGWRAHGIRVLEGACLQLGGTGPPYAPVVGVLRSLAREVEPGALAAILGPGRAHLARLVPSLVERSTDVPVEAADATSQVRLFELVAGALERLSRREPLVVAIEDAHWADRSSRDLVDFLVRGLHDGVRLLLILTFRTDALAPGDPARTWIAELTRLAGVERIDLGPLGRAEVATLVADILGRDPGVDFVQHVMDRANGNAFLSEELAAAGERDDGPLPEHLREILLGRLAPVAPETREVLRSAAAAGRWVDDGLLEDALGLGPAPVHAALREAVAHGVLVADPPTGALRFRHTLLRDAVDAELFPGERQRLHLAYAAALERRSAAGGDGVAPEELAYHWDAGNRPERAVPAHLLAARAAAAVYAWAEACRAYDRALELAARAPGALPPGELPGILLEAAKAWALQGDYERAVGLARRAADLIDPSVEPARAAAIHQDLRWYLWEAGDTAAAAAEVAEALRLTPAAPASFLRARAVAHAAGLEMSAGRPVEALRLANEAVETARAAEAPAEEALGLGIAGWAVAAMGDVDGGAERFRAAMAIARRLGGWEGVALGYTNLTAILDRAGRTDEALAVAREGFAEVERFGLSRTFGVPLLASAARMCFHQGRWDEVDRLLEQARSLGPLPTAEVAVDLLAARLAAARGQFDAARAALARAATVERSAPALQARAELAAWSDDLPGGRAVVDAALARPIASPLPDPALAWVAAIGLRLEGDAAASARHRRDEAARAEAERRIAAIGGWLEAGLGAIGGDVERASVGDPRIAVMAAQCLAERDRGLDRSDAAAWAGVAARWQALGRPLPAAYARLREAEAALVSPGGRDAARPALRAAATIAGELGAAPLLTAAERLARLARIDLGPAPVDAGGAPPGRDAGGEAKAPAHRDLAAGEALGLTARELEVLRLVADGWSNPQIADELGISPKTASVHVSNLLGKLGVPNRVEAAVAAMRLGLADERPAAAVEVVGAGPGGADRPVGISQPGAQGAATPGRSVHRAFMFTDIVRSTPLVEAIGDAAWQDLLAWHDTALRQLFARYEGQEVDHAGDGFFVAFRSTRRAIDCAVAIQRMLAAHRGGSGFAPSLRIGVHAGDAIAREPGYVGSAVHVAARIAAHAEGGRVLASAAALREAGLRPAVAPEDVELPGVKGRVAVAEVPW